jgi:hypothetical protein
VLPFGVSTLEFALVTFASAFVGISLVIGVSRFVKVNLLAAFALGVYLWYFTDTLGDSNYLNVLAGPVFSAELVELVTLFAVGLVAFFVMDGRIFSDGGEAGKYGMFAAMLAALALGLHGFGEGADFGFTAAQTPINTLLGAFGGLTEGASWVLHKALEPAIAAVCYVAFTGSQPRKATDKLIDALALATVFVIPPVVGSVAGYYLSFDHTYIFALGLGASVYAIAKVGRALYSSGGGAQRWLSLKMAVATLIGLLLIFIAALLHS